MKIRIEKISVDELATFADLIKLFGDVFVMKNFAIASEGHLRNLLQDKNFVAFSATADNDLAGGLTGYVFNQYHSERSLVYLYDLAVLPGFQRKGIGSALLKGLIDFSRTLGAEELFVQADEVDLQAIEFYHKTGGIGEKVIHFSYLINQGE